MKRYFDNEDDGGCYPLNYFKELMAETNETEMFLWEGIIENGTDHFWCSNFQEIGLKSENTCGSGCTAYAPRNGKTGRCKHSKNTYFHGDKYLLVRTGKKFTITKQTETLKVN